MKKVGSESSSAVPCPNLLNFQTQCCGILLISSKDMILPRLVCLKSTNSCHSYSQYFSCWPTIYADEPALKETGPGFQGWAKDSCWQRWKSDHLLLAQSCQQVRALERLCPNSILMLNKMGLACSSLCWKDPFIPLYSIYMIVTTQRGKLTSHINNLQPSS